MQTNNQRFYLAHTTDIPLWFFWELQEFVLEMNSEGDCFKGILVNSHTSLSSRYELFDESSNNNTTYFYDTYQAFKRLHKTWSHLILTTSGEISLLLTFPSCPSFLGISFQWRTHFSCRGGAQTPMPFQFSWSLPAVTQSTSPDLPCWLYSMSSLSKVQGFSTLSTY